MLAAVAPILTKTIAFVEKPNWGSSRVVATKLAKPTKLIQETVQDSGFVSCSVWVAKPNSLSGRSVAPLARNENNLDSKPWLESPTKLPTARKMGDVLGHGP